MPQATAVPPAVRQMLALALDVDDSVLAMRWAERLRPWFGVAKVGLELFCAAGPSVVTELLDAGFDVFVDMKLADIPTTTGRAAKVLGALGASYVTVHTFAGPAVLQAGVEGLAEGAESAGLRPPMALGVTVLTSEPEASVELLTARVAAAAAAGCGGVVCAAADLRTVKQLAPALVAVVPGIRLAGSGPDDHGRPATPSDAVKSGAGLLVIGRAVTGATGPHGPEEAAASIAGQVASSL
jgi:orotidine-5'-phosphate decarboxylase